MNPIVRNILAVLAGLIVGSAVNMALVILGPSIVSLPEGADISTPEAMGESIKLFGPANFIFPFLGHALGTLVGAFLAARLAASHGMKLALGIGVYFLFGGISMVVLYGGPVWFAIVDLVLAYLPMGYLGGMLGWKKRS